MRYLRGSKVYFLATALTVCGWAQDSKSTAQSDPVAAWKTEGLFNGRFWRAAESQHKSTFLMGYRDAVMVAATIAYQSSFEGFDKLTKVCWPDKLTIGEVQSALDRFYEIPENGPIGIYPNGTIFRYFVETV